MREEMSVKEGCVYQITGKFYCSEWAAVRGYPVTLTKGNALLLSKNHGKPELYEKYKSYYTFLIEDKIFVTSMVFYKDMLELIA